MRKLKKIRRQVKVNFCQAYDNNECIIINNNVGC